MILQKKRVHLLIFIVGVIALSTTAEYCRKLVGEKAASKSGQFTFLNCFDGGSGTLACLIKEGVKLYFYNIRSIHVERERNKAIEAAVADALSQGMTAKDAANQAQKEGAKAGKLATRQAKRIIGPIISSGWDFFEALYFGGTMTEGFLRGTGTLFGTYYVGFIGEQSLGRFGYLVGSHLGSWIGGRIGLMVYDLVNGAEYLLQAYQSVETTTDDPLPDEVYEMSAFGSSEVSEDSSASESPSYTSSQSPEDANIDRLSDEVYETSAFGGSEAAKESFSSETSTSFGSPEDANTEEASTQESLEYHEEL